MELGEEFSSGRGGVGKLLLRMIGLHGICESGFTLRACRTCRRGSQTATNPLFFFIHLQEEVAYFLFLGIGCGRRPSFALGVSGLVLHDFHENSL